MSKTLDEKLTDLIAQATVQNQTHQTSREQLHQAIVDAYLWWREADKVKDYLAKAYAADGITVRRKSTAAAPNFYPLVRLIWKLDPMKQAGTVSNWAKSLAGLHKTYIEKQASFGSDLRGELINLISDVGGLGGLRGEKRMTEKELEDEEQGPSTTTAKTEEVAAIAAVAPPSVMQAKLAKAKQVSAKATIATFPTAVANTSQLIAMVGRRTATGQIEVIGTNYKDNLVLPLLNACLATDRSAVTPSLRIVAEALEAHALPAPLEKYRSKFFADSAVTRPNTTKALDSNGQPIVEQVALKQTTRLRYRPASNDFLVSKAMTDASIVSYVRPKQPFDCAEEVILNGTDRSWIESDLLNRETLTLYSAAPDFGLSVSSTKGAGHYELAVSNINGKHSRKLHFDAASQVPKDTNAQCVIADPAKLSWDWRLEASVQWLQQFDALCATPYLSKVRGGFDKPKFASICLHVGKDRADWNFWWDEKRGSYAESYSALYGKDAKRGKTQLEAPKFTANAKDFAAVFAVLPGLPITSAHVMLEGNAHVLRVSYSTELADYETYIPAADAVGKRDTTAFDQYGA